MLDDVSSGADEDLEKRGRMPMNSVIGTAINNASRHSEAMIVLGMYLLQSCSIQCCLKYLNLSRWKLVASLSKMSAESYPKEERLAPFPHAKESEAQKAFYLPLHLLFLFNKYHYNQFASIW